MDLSAGSLALSAVKAAYDLWKDNKGVAALALSKKAKDVLAMMQTDPTENGVFLCTRGLGDVGLPLSCLYHTEIRITTTERVMAELEAKGLVSEDYTSQGSRRFKLTHAGWILNPVTGMAGKAG